MTSGLNHDGLNDTAYDSSRQLTNAYQLPTLIIDLHDRYRGRRNA